MNNMLVMKFGGSSVGSPKRIREVADIVCCEEGRRIVVLSAMSGVTNTLVEISMHFRQGNVSGAKMLIEELRQKYYIAIEELYEKEENRASAKQYVDKKLEYIDSFSIDMFGDFEEKCVLAQGEPISIEMFRLHLSEKGMYAEILPALEYMCTDKYGEPNMPAIQSKLKALLEQYPDVSLFVTEGYICLNAYSEIDNLKRGGSDYTASIIGACIDAREIQIWTDIDGMHNNDPRVVEGTVPVHKLHFDEAAELAYFGAKILHPTCIYPAKMQNIPVRILNTFDPGAEGTYISNAIEEGSIKAVAVKDNITAVKILSGRMLMAYGFLRKVFEVFERHLTPIDMVTTSEVAISVTIDNTDRLEEILAELKRLGDVSLDHNMSIICIAGDLNWKNIGFEAAIIDALDEIPVRMISYGGSNYNVSVLIRSEDREKALKSLNRHLFCKKEV